MVRAMRRIPVLFVPCTLACADGGKEEQDQQSVEQYACLHIAEGELRDVSLYPEQAGSIEVGRTPYRVNVYPQQAGYLAFDEAARDLVLLLDFAGAVPAVWTGEERTELTPGEPNPHCDEDLVEVLYFSVPEGPHLLEVGPIFEANVWMMLAEG